MNPLMMKETVELLKPQSEISNTTKAFEKSKIEIKAPKHISTINENLEGKFHEKTDVKYAKKIVSYNGERLEGVFPKFEAHFETRLPQDLWKASDAEQFKFCTKQLEKQMESNPDLAKRFGPWRERIENGEPRIPGFTWHHTEVPGKMQLVDAGIHAETRHTGGRSIWGGGSDLR